jgi:transketolase
LICCKTIIGFGSPNKQGKEESHGSALGEAEVALARKELGWEHAPFEVPENIYQAWDARTAGARANADWQEKFAAYQAAHPELAAELERRLTGSLPADFEARADAFVAQCQEAKANIASRKASENTLNVFGPLLPELIGGSADLGGSNNTVWKGCQSITADDASGNYIHYGVREFAMTAIMNGMVLHGGMRPYGGTFLMFMEYARNAVRMAALMGQPSILVYTHDSIGLGEDGPTHQPVEQLANLRLTPNLSCWRPCDTVETAIAWKLAIQQQKKPTALVFSRQNLVCMERNAATVKQIQKGGYTLLQTGSGMPDAIIIATGSEVELAVKAAQSLGEKGRNIRVVSMPSTDTFLAQDIDYQDNVLPGKVRNRVAVEAGIADYWYRFVGLDGKVVGMRSFGASAPAKVLFEHFGITTKAVVEAVESLF